MHLTYDNYIARPIVIAIKVSGTAASSSFAPSVQ